MSTAQHLMENALIEYCTYLRKDRQERHSDFHFSDLVKEQAEECGVNLDALLEMCVYTVFDYGESIQYETEELMEDRYGYSPTGYIDSPSVYIDSYARK